MDYAHVRMAIEDDDVRDREVWTAVSRHWYSRASDKAPTTGRLYHHLAILARPNIVAQLFYYAKSLCVPIPFNSTRESILTLFDPIMTGTHGKLHPVDRALVKCHGTFFTGKGTAELEKARNEFLFNLDLAVAKGAPRWLESGYQIAVSNICALLDYGLATNVLMRAIYASTKPPQMPKIVVADEPASIESRADSSELQKPANADDEHVPNTTVEAEVDVVDLAKRFKEVLQFVENTDAVVLSRLGDLNILSYLNVRLMFLHQMAILKGPGGSKPKISAMLHLEFSFPWHLRPVRRVERRTQEALSLPPASAFQGAQWARLISLDSLLLQDAANVAEHPKMGSYSWCRTILTTPVWVGVPGEMSALARYITTY